MPAIPRPILVFFIALVAMASGCAGRTPDPAPTGNVPSPQAGMPADEKPEPLPPGIKPLTVEQEEMITQ